MIDSYDFAEKDIISELTFGESFNCIDSEHVHSWNRMFHESLRALSRFASFEFSNFLATECSLLLVLPRSVTESVHAQFDLTR